MPLSLADLPATARLTALVIVPHTGSTNADLVARATADDASLPHLALLVTDDQRAGRGRLGRTWTAAPGASIAVSVYLAPHSVPDAARGWVPLIAGAAMARAIAAQLPVHTTKVKWPNDVLVDGRKICGILAEVVPGGGIVVGAGVNTQMSEADLPVPSAVSFGALGVECDVDALLTAFLSALDEQLVALVASGGEAACAGVRGEVTALCGTLGQAVRVELPGGEVLVGTAARLDAGGELVVETDDGDVSVSAGDVIHLR